MCNLVLFNSLSSYNESVLDLQTSASERPWNSKKNNVLSEKTGHTPFRFSSPEMSRTKTVTTTHVIPLIPYSRVLLQKLTGFQLVRKLPVFYGTRRFITAFTTDLHLSLSWASFRLYQSISPGPRLSVWTFRNKIRFHGEEFLAPRPTPKLDHPLSAVRDCLLNIFAATPHIGGRSSIRSLRTRHAVVTDPLITNIIPLPNFFYPNS
jgi:hypothetical protein